MLDFRPGQATFFCSTQLVAYQRMQILGTDGRIEIEIPFNAPPDQPCRIFLDDGSALGGRSARAEILDVVNQYSCRAISSPAPSAAAPNCPSRSRIRS